jgi:hypothetical protein
MYDRKMNYDAAHEIANKVEWEHRRIPCDKEDALDFTPEWALEVADACKGR